MASLGYSFKDQKSASESARDIQDKLQLASAILSKAKANGTQEKLSESELRTKLASLAKLDAELSTDGKNATSVREQCANALSRQTQCTTRLNTLEGRLKNAEQQLATAGHGTEKPACWADRTGKPEYIFDIALKSQSVVVRDNALPGRTAEQAVLPIKALSFSLDLGQQDFRAQTRALFEWSEREGCRFFVRVYDLTAAHEKDAYKRQLRTVGEHFYYYEELSRPWRDEHVGGDGG